MVSLKAKKKFITKTKLLFKKIYYLVIESLSLLMLTKIFSILNKVVSINSLILKQDIRINFFNITLKTKEFHSLVFKLLFV